MAWEMAVLHTVRDNQRRFISGIEYGLTVRCISQRPSNTKKFNQIFSNSFVYHLYTKIIHCAAFLHHVALHCKDQACLDFFFFFFSKILIIQLSADYHYFTVFGISKVTEYMYKYNRATLELSLVGEAK